MKLKIPILILLASLLLVGIVDADPAPVAAFSANVTTGCAPLHVAFTDATTRSPINWDWYFWNNETKSSDLQNPTYVFPAGTYNVRLYANTATHGDWENKSSYISTLSAP